MLQNIGIMVWLPLNMYSRVVVVIMSRRLKDGGVTTFGIKASFSRLPTKTRKFSAIFLRREFSQKKFQT